MTTKIRFKDIIKAIKVFLNFHPDSFPIILSFENHCSVPYQEVMARLLLDILGERLYVPTEASLFGRLPSPQEYVQYICYSSVLVRHGHIVSHAVLCIIFSLRGMVVIKGRRPNGTVDVDGYDTGDDSDEEEGQEVPLDEKVGCHQ
jgi:phosphatidylinositol phospholipase C delta